MKRIFALSLAIVVVAAAVFVAVALAGKPKAQSQSEHVTDQYAQRFQNAVPYPTALMHDSQERRNLRERLLRFNKPDKIGYVYLLGFNGDFVGYYAVRGKVSSTQSQLTSPDQSWDNGEHVVAVVASMGDDGSYGSNEGGDGGIFFFTTNNVLVETTMNWIYSDSPLPVSAKRINPKRGQTNVSKRAGS